MTVKPELQAKLNEVIKTIDGSQPIDLHGAIAALQAVIAADQACVCKHCGTATMVENWRGSGAGNMHCLTCNN
jgi:hypothetical protein